MITAAEREEEFRKDLKKLLLKHEAMLDLDTKEDIYFGTGYPTLEVTMCTVVGENTRDIKREYTNFELDVDTL